MKKNSNKFKILLIIWIKKVVYYMNKSIKNLKINIYKNILKG